ncbi:MAG: c-type cytochrome [Bacteroidetes bacterium]|nr:c-type cytochrome [Bacteroidota bacterium]
MKNKAISLNKIWLTVTLLVPGFATWAQAAASSNKVPDIFLSNEFYVSLLIILIMLLVITTMGKTIRNLAKMVSEKSNYTKAIVLLLLAGASSANAQADQAATTKAPTPPEWLLSGNFILSAFIILILICAIIILYRVNMRLLKFINNEQTQPQAEMAAETEEAPSWMRSIYLWMVDSVPVAKEKDILLDHDYDGIHELDNNLPPWWKYGFYFTIAWSFFYLVYYHAGTGRLQAQEYNDELAEAKREKEERLRASADNVNEENVTVLADAAAISSGKEVFVKLCASCHKEDGGGQVGPNLTDEYWLHGGGIKNVFKTIVYGVPQKGMISWQSQLTPKQIQQVSSYILTMQGTKPVGAKEAQGDIWTEKAAPAAADTTVTAVVAAATDSVK